MIRARKHTSGIRVGTLLVAGMAWLGCLIHSQDVAEAMHEIDHRFTVEGHVCWDDGRPASETKVLVKDTRVSVGLSVVTDAHGYYKATLHLHNDNAGDPILVAALEKEQQVTAKFDPKNVQEERKVTVNIGSGCEQQAGEAGQWVWYGAGIGAVAVAAVVGARYVKQRQRSQKRGKAQRK
jgi:hypothetical protein